MRSWYMSLTCVVGAALWLAVLGLPETSLAVTPESAGARGTVGVLPVEREKLTDEVVGVTKLLRYNGSSFTCRNGFPDVSALLSTGFAFLGQLLLTGYGRSRIGQGLGEAEVRGFEQFLDRCPWGGNLVDPGVAGDRHFRHA